MNLIVTIVENTDVDKVMTALTDQHISVTHVSSNGGLFSPVNCTLLIGVETPGVTQVMTVIGDLAAERQAFIPYAHGGNTPLAGFTEVQVGGFLSFVLAVDHFEQV